MDTLPSMSCSLLSLSRSKIFTSTGDSDFRPWNHIIFSFKRSGFMFISEIFINVKPFWVSSWVIEFQISCLVLSVSALFKTPHLIWHSEDIKFTRRSANIVVFAFNLNPHILSQLYKFWTVHKVWLNFTFCFSSIFYFNLTFSFFFLGWISFIKTNKWIYSPDLTGTLNHKKLVLWTKKKIRKSPSYLQITGQYTK